MSRLLTRCAAVAMASAMFFGTVFAPVVVAGPSPTISSDQPDYPAGSTVTLTGTGWDAGEAVHIFVNDDAGQTWSHSADVTADDQGGFADAFQLPDWFIATYHVTATGATSGTATTTFTDGNIKVQASSGELFTLIKTVYSTTTCSGTVVSGPTTVNNVNDSSGDTTGASATQSVKLQASGLANSTAPFASWSSSSSFTIINSTTICAPGFGSGSPHVYTANYTSDSAPSVLSTAPSNLAANVALNASIVVTFSESVAVDDVGPPVWLTMSCPTSGGHTSHTTSSGGGGTTWTFDPTADFAANETCTATIHGNAVTDSDTIDPPNNMAANNVFTFTTAASDGQAPQNPLVTINGGATYTNSTTGNSLGVSATDNVGVTAYRVANGSDCSGASYVAVASTTSFSATVSPWTLAAGPDGTRTVCAQFKDAAGNESAVATDTILLDGTAPSISKSVYGSPQYTSGGDTFVTSATTLRVNVVEAGSGLSTCVVTVDGPTSNDTTFNCSTGNNDFTLGGVLTTPPDGSYTISVDATDNATNPASDPLTVILDNTGPDSFAETLGSPNFTDGSSNVWVKSTTNISVSGDDGTGSGVASCGLDFDAAGTPSAYTLGTNFNMPSGDGAHSYAVDCTDNLGNASATFSKTRYVDDTAPDNFAETLGSPNYTDGSSNVWVKSTTNISVSGDDGTGSGVASCTKAFDGGATSAYSLTTNFNMPSGDGAHSYAIVCQDNLTNTSSPFGKTRYVDDTGPVVTVTGVTNGATYILGSVPVAGCNTSDGAGSGVATNATLTGPTGLSVNGVGTAHGSCGGALDHLGNPQSPDPLNFTFYVVYGGVSGILQPINPDNTSVFKRGQAIPVKFMLAGDEFFGFITTGWTIQRQSVPCSVFDGQDATLESVASNTPSQFFRYDASADQYIYNADMHNLGVGTCWNFKVTLDSGQVLYSAVFKLTK